MRLLVDMNLSPAWVSWLESSGFVATHWSSVGLPNASDRTLFEWARDNGYVVFAHDLDFGAMLAITGAEAPSVFQIRTEDVSTDALGVRAVSILQRFTPELSAGALIVVDDARDRVRILPLSQS
ncbi:MAG: DUF5615 family PIN-like protein [Rhodocyclales bacterium]|nr:DUF5615 family PIN-like protein [Rhodocyclales bacterium]